MMPHLHVPEIYSNVSKVFMITSGFLPAKQSANQQANRLLTTLDGCDQPFSLPAGQPASKLVTQPTSQTDTQTDS